MNSIFDLFLFCSFWFRIVSKFFSTCTSTKIQVDVFSNLWWQISRIIMNFLLSWDLRLCTILKIKYTRAAIYLRNNKLKQIFVIENDFIIFRNILQDDWSKHVLLDAAHLGLITFRLVRIDPRLVTYVNVTRVILLIIILFLSIFQLSIFYG